MSHVPYAYSQRRNLATAERRRRLAHGKGAVSKPAAPAAPAPAEEAPAEAPAETLAILDGSVSAVESALATGDHDAWLAQLLEAEKAGKNRKTAIAAIEARM